MKPESCTGWKGLAVTTSLEHDVPPLFDYRWNGKYLWRVVCVSQSSSITGTFAVLHIGFHFGKRQSFILS
jgi:hypothetical protein